MTDDLVEEYLTHLRSRGRAPATLAGHRWHLQRFFKFCRSRGLTLAEITQDTLLDYHRELRQVPGERGRLWTERSVVRALQDLNLFLAWCQERRYLLVAPELAWPGKRPPATLPALLTADQALALVEVPGEDTALQLRDRTLLELLYSTGLRRTECQQLDLTDLDLANSQLLVRHAKGGGFRYVPVGEHLAGVLERYLAEGRPHLRPFPEEPALFVTPQTGRRLSGAQLYNVVKRCARQLGLQAGVHSLRHAFASHLLEGGADVRQVQELLGHRLVSSTQHYTQLQPLELIREHRHPHPRGRRR
jgi:integrase/recombinase XerD